MNLKSGIIFLGIALWATNISSCEQFPRDPDDTLQKVRNGTLVAGITENPPYVVYEETGPVGIEVDMIKALAKHLKAEVIWIKGSEETIMTLLKERQADICAGGFDHKSLWKKHVYLMRPHDTLTYKWAVPAASGLPGNIKDMRVYVRKGSSAAAYAGKRGGIVVYVDSVEGVEPLVVAPEEELKELNYTVSEKVLKKKKISLAGPKGENAFLEVVEKFISEYEGKSKK